MKLTKPPTFKRGSLLRKFSVLYVGFALIPFLLFFYLYSRYDPTHSHILVSKNYLSILILLVGAGCLAGFFGMRSSLVKIVRLAENLKESAMGKIDRNIIMEIVNGEGEVAELAKSFGQVFTRLEDNIKELEETKKTLHQVLSKVSQALSSTESFDLLVSLILETAIDALGAKNGAIFSLEEDETFTLKAWSGKTKEPDDKVLKEAASYLQWVSNEKKIFVLPSIEKEQSEKKLFNPPIVCAPLLCRDKLWGAICLSGNRFGNNFADNELNIITNLSYQIAISFENAQLNKDREQTYFETMAALAMAVEARDPYSRGHSDRVGEIAGAIGNAMGLSEEDLKTLQDASKLHDIGKIGISDSILTKPGRLTKEEFEVMQNHPEIGEGIVLPLKNFNHLVEPIRHHHEKLDGSGYPDGLKGDDIPIITRIMTVADIFDALTEDRAYRKAMTIEETKKEFDHLASMGKIDKDVLDTLYKLVDAKVL
jgi:HD-GYP domain-containing protein (c-di-GMP phosphodiesterase class II)